MKKLLLSEICHPQTNILDALSLINHHLLDDELVNVGFLTEFADQAIEAMADIDDPLDRAERLLEFLYIEGNFIDLTKGRCKLDEFKIKQSFDYRQVAPILKLVMFRHIIRLAGFVSDVVFVPDQLMLRIICDDEFAIIFDVVSGEAISWQDLDYRLEQDSASWGQLQLNIINNASLILKYLQDLKISLINAAKFDKALECTDIMVALLSKAGMKEIVKDGAFPYFAQLHIAFDDVQFYLNKMEKYQEDKLLQHSLDAVKIPNSIH